MMSIIYKLPYLIKEGIRNLWHNRLMSISSIGVLGVCLLLISNAVLIGSNINAMVSQIGTENAVVVYLQDGTDEQTAKDLGAKLLALENIKSVEFLSSEDALNNWKEVLSEYPDLLEGIESDFLPPSYTISVIDLEKLDETVYQLEKLEEISSIRQMAELADKLIGIRNAVSAALYAIVAVLFIVSMFIIVNTVKLAMFSRRKEISIMKYVGGTDWFIRLPFIVEGFFIGFIAAALSYFAQWYIYDYAIIQLVESVNFISPIPFDSFSGVLYISLTAFGCVVGMAGSLMSIGKYLKV